MSDQDRISPYNIHTISNRQVMRIKININWGVISWSKQIKKAYWAENWLLKWMISRFTFTILKKPYSEIINLCDIENMGYHYKYVFISHGQKLSTVFWYSPVELTEKPIFRDLDNSEMLFQSVQRTHFDIIINFQNNIRKESYCWNSRIFSPDEMVVRIHNCQKWTRPRLILRLHHVKKW